MILQALAHHYDTLSASGKISPPGWAESKVSYALCLAADGTLQQVVCIKTEQTKGKKTVLAPQLLRLPAPVKRTVGISPNFLFDTSSYVLGVDTKGKPERAKECFEAFRALHQSLLGDIDTPAANAVLAFLNSWEPDKLAEHPAFAAYDEELLSGVNLVFRIEGSYAQDDPCIRQAWNEHSADAGDGPEMICLITGKKGPVESIHPSIKNVQGAQSSGAALVSFNAPAFCSYGKEQNLNAPVSKAAAFAYTSALNYLLADREHTCRVGDCTVVYWAENGSVASQNLFGGFFGQSDSYTADELLDTVRSLCKGNHVEFEQELLDPDMQFYVLGISPNAARLSVRFFYRNTLGHLLQNVLAHHQRMEITRPSYDKFVTLPLWKMLGETVNQNARDKSAAPNLAGDTLRAILNNTPYPASLLNGVRLRIHAEQEVTRGRAAILKAYYLKHDTPDIPNKEEVLTVSLNRESTSVPYTLGRLFSVLEAIQSAAADGNLNTTIKDRYFNSASATPGHVFPTLVNLAQKHLKKIASKKGINWATYFDKQLTELMGRLDDSYPTHLSIPEQGVFQLGYYHETQARYEKKNQEEQ